ncbi:MAG: ABC transporter substrate-binding protein [Chloroflexi bacterium]|nr:ABC transporter substrate-binding protein [Chloroflexota bacterium]
MSHSGFREVARHSLAVILAVVLVGVCALGSTTLACHSLQQVSIQLQWVTQAQFAGYYVALDKGWYLEEGIDLTIKPGGPDIAPVDMVATGESQFGTSFLADLCVAIQKGEEVISISQIQQKNGLLLIAKKSSGIEEPRDLVGKRVGVWIGSWEAQFDVLMANEGIALQDVQVTSQGSSVDPFLEGDWDVVSAMIYNEYQTLLESGLTAEDLNVIDYADYGLGFPGDTLFTSREIAEQHPDLCVRMLRASLRGWQYAIDYPEQAADIVLKYDESGLQTRQHQISMMKEISKLIRMTGRDVGYTDRTSVKQTIYVLRYSGILGGPLQPEDVCTNDFWDQAHEE